MTNPMRERWIFNDEHTLYIEHIDGDFDESEHIIKPFKYDGNWLFKTPFSPMPYMLAKETDVITVKYEKAESKQKKEEGFMSLILKTLKRFIQ